MKCNIDWNTDKTIAWHCKEYENNTSYVACDTDNKFLGGKWTEGHETRT